MNILYEDEQCLVVSKPPGISTQAPPIAGPTLETAVRAYLRPDDPASAYVGTVHRLDRPVSGVILWAKTPRASRLLSRQFEGRRVGKIYWAIVEGRWTQVDALWEDWICREDTGLGRVQVCEPGTPRSQRALTRVCSLETGSLPEACSGLRLEPETGRMHQLRVQCARRGMPILGDQLYGSSRTFPEGIALHARLLTIHHPLTGAPMTFRAPVPESWARAGFILPGDVRD